MTVRESRHREVACVLSHSHRSHHDVLGMPLQLGPPLQVSGMTASLDPVKLQGKLRQAQLLLHRRGGQARCRQAAISSTCILASLSLQGSPRSKTARDHANW